MKILHTNLSRLLYLRPREFQEYVTSVKVLYKYQRLSNELTQAHEKFLTSVFSSTCYPFTWNLHYDKETNQIIKDHHLSIEKKILFRFNQIN